MYIALDRDGTVIREAEFLHDPEGVELLPGVAEALTLFQDKGFTLVIITNQSGVGRGYFSEEAMRATNDRVVELLAEKGICIAGMYVCPHAPDSGCTCRKPAPGLLKQMAHELDLKLADGVVIGDKASDVNLARAVGAKGILVRTGYGKKTEAEEKCAPDHVVDDLLSAARVICGEAETP